MLGVRARLAVHTNRRRTTFQHERGRADRFLLDMDVHGALLATVDAPRAQALSATASVPLKPALAVEGVGAPPSPLPGDVHNVDGPLSGRPVHVAHAVVANVRVPQIFVPNASHHGLDGVADAHPFGGRQRKVNLVRRRKLLLPGVVFYSIRLNMWVSSKMTKNTATVNSPIPMETSGWGSGEMANV